MTRCFVKCNILLLLTLGTAMTLTLSTAGLSTAAASPPSGASAAWTSDDPNLVRARALLEEGRFADAERLVAGEGRAESEMREIIRRLRREYSQSESALLEKLRRSIPDVSADDLARWRDAGKVQFRVIDGEVAYFRREPSNIFRFCDEAKQRRDAHAKNEPKPEPAKPTFVLTDHLKEVIRDAEPSGEVEVIPIRHTITYRLTVKPDRPDAKAGSTVRVWLPYPQEYRQQTDVKLISTSPKEHVLAPNCDGETKLTGAPQRTIFFEQRIDDPSKPITFEAVYEYTSAAYYPILRDEDARPLPADWGGAELGERLPHIALTPELRSTVAQIVGDETNPLAKARKIFHWMDENIRYHAEEEYCVIPSFSEAALTRRRGDCGVQSILFIAMCRAAGVPARWQSGWETKPENWNMHDWAEFYVAPWGWLPADPSYGLQKSDDPKVREFYFGHQDSYRLIVNRDYGNELVPPKQSLRSEPADFQRGEVEIDGRNLYFDEWDWEFKFEQERVDR